MNGFALIFRALITGPARRHPIRVAAPGHRRRDRGRGGRRDPPRQPQRDRVVPRRRRRRLGPQRLRRDRRRRDPRRGARGPRVPLADRVLRAGRRRARPSSTTAAARSRRSSASTGAATARSATSGWSTRRARRRGRRCWPRPAPSSSRSRSPRATISLREPRSRSSRAACATGRGSAGSWSSRAWRGPPAETSSSPTFSRPRTCSERRASSTAWTSCSIRACRGPTAGREIAARLPPGLALEPPGRAAADGGPDGARLPPEPERPRLAHPARRDLPDRQRRVDRGAAPPARDRDAARPRGLAFARSSPPFSPRGSPIGIAGTLLGEVLGLFVSRAALRAVGGTVSSIYLPTARIAGRGLRRRRVARGRRRHARPRSSRTLLPAIEATRVEPSPAMRPGSIEGVARRRLSAARRPAPRRRLAGGRRSLARRARRRVSALRIRRRRARRRSRSRSPRRWRVRLGAALPGPPARAPRSRGAPGRGVLRRRARAQRHRRHRAGDGARHDARDDRDRGVDPRNRQGLGRVDAALGPLDQGRRRGPLRHRRRPSGRDHRVSRGDRRRRGGRPVSRARDDRRRRTSLHARLGRLPGRGPRGRPAPARRQGSAARRARGAGARGGPRLRALRPPLRRRGRLGRDGRDARGARAASAWRASTATTRTTAAPS